MSEYEECGATAEWGHDEGSVWMRHDDPDGNEYEGWCCECSRMCYSDRACYCCLASEVERLTAALAESEAARTFAEGHSAALSKQLDRVNMLRIRALNGLREQTKVTIDQGVALADRDQKIAELAAEVERLERAEAAIARVRELCDQRDAEVAASDPLFGPPLTLTVAEVRRALGGAE